MTQTLLIGLGGTGGRVVNNVVKKLRLNKKEINNGEICCAVLDTDFNDNELIANSNTDVLVVPMSKDKKIRDYFDEYRYLHMETWCPQSPAFLEETMIDGASELRVKSRIAFMDCLESGIVDQLELMINDVLKNNSGSKIRIMIVSSLSGGTGSGMFIQVALWLRKFLSESQITIRGIFMLPDVFVSTVKDIRDNKTTTVRHYCNAYAAIRELNAITKIKMNNSADLPEKIEIGDLFDSIRDRGSGKPVYDFAFLVDDRDENGFRLESFSEYEKMVAQLVYMQLYASYAPMNGVLPLNAIINNEPLYGSCGTAKAVYPTESVKTYCAIRAVQDSLTGRWKKIDDEINALLEEKKQEEKDGIYSSKTIDVRSQYIKLFDEKTSIKEDEAGIDRFFISISKDTKNETKVKAEGDKVSIKYEDKVDDFLKLLKSQIIDTVVNQYSGTYDYAIDADAFVSADHTKDELLKRIKADESGLKEALDNFDAKVEEYADRIVNSVFPYSMGDVKDSNKCSIYGLFTKLNDKGTWNFIHPVAARYVLYKLVNNMECVLKGIALKDSREEALSGGEIGTLFDNNATLKTETSADDYINSRRWYQSEGSFYNGLKRRYAIFITSKIELCKKYEKECLQVSVYRKLIERLNGLIKQIETFFKKLGDVQKKLDDALKDNIGETDGIVGKTMYILGSKEDKEAIYKTLDFELDSSNVKINKSVIDAIYGRLCAEKRPLNPENASYLDISVITLFTKETIKSFREKIDSDANNRENVNMDIYTALCRENDEEFEKKVGNETGDVGFTANNLTAQRHRDALIACKNKLFRMAAPFLVYEWNDTATLRLKAFWGFSPDIIITCPFIGTALGVNADLQSDDAYPKNELYCYREVYGIEAVNIPKFNELNGGSYYTCYRSVVDSMVKDADGKQGTRALVRTPHLDMNWYRILPYITKEK